MKKVILFSLLVVGLLSCGERRRSTPVVKDGTADELVLKQINSMKRPIIMVAGAVMDLKPTIVLKDGNNQIHTFSNTKTVNAIMVSYQVNDTISK